MLMFLLKLLSFTQVSNHFHITTTVTNRVGGNTVLAGLSYIRKSNLDRITVKVSKLPQLTMNEMFLEPTRC